ncbi:unnamed protein product [Durusdinium trenchii]|uniref:PARP-type domain-containing protein n=1 Tax=Durusdinium trenchii TaxID=1381693 RepID=A0ABP0QNF1_9DINO
MAESVDNQLGNEVTQIYDTQPESHEGDKAEEVEEPTPPPQPATPQSATQSVASVHGPKAVEQFGWSDLKKAPQDYCSNCKRPVNAVPTHVVRKKGHAGVHCRTCHNVTSMLYKKIDMKNLEGWKDFSSDQMADFFIKAGQCSDPSGNLQWAKLKGCLVDSMCEHERHIRETSVKGKYLPLSVYAKKGFDTAAIEARAEKKESDLFGYVYKVPILQTGFTHLEEDVRSRVLQAERKIPSKRAKSKTGDQEQENQENEDPDEIDEHDFKDWESISSSGSEKADKNKKRSGKGKAPKRKENHVSKEAKAEARKENSKVLGLCRKAVRLLEPLVKDGKKASKSEYGSAHLKQEYDAASQILKSSQKLIIEGPQATANGKILEYQYDDSTIKELHKSLKQRVESTKQVEMFLTKMDDSALEKFAKAAQEHLSKNVD